MSDVIKRLHNAVIEDQNAVMYCVRLQDLINEASAELERLRTKSEELKQERDRLQEFSKIVDGINPLTLQKAEMLTEEGYRVAGFYLEKTGYDKCFIQHAHVAWVRDEEA